MGGTREGRRIRQALREIQSGRPAYKIDGRIRALAWWRQKSGVGQGDIGVGGAWRQASIADVFHSFDLVILYRNELLVALTTGPIILSVYVGWRPSFDGTGDGASRHRP